MFLGVVAVLLLVSSVSLILIAGYGLGQKADGLGFPASG